MEGLGVPGAEMLEPVSLMHMDSTLGLLAYAVLSRMRVAGSW